MNSLARVLRTMRTFSHSSIDGQGCNRKMEYENIESKNSNENGNARKVKDFLCRCHSDNWTKLIYTFCIWTACFNAGLVSRQLGPAHQDIQEKTHVTFSESSTFVTSLNISFVIGSLVTPIIHNRIQGFFVLFVTGLGVGTSTILVPWSFSLISAVFIYGIFGFFSGIVASFVMAEISALWGKNMGFWLQILYILYAIGGIMGPLETAPFLSAEKTKGTSEVAINGTAAPTRVHGAFILSGSTVIVTAVIFAIFYVLSYCNIIQGAKDMYTPIEERKPDSTTLSSKVTGMVLFAIYISTSTALSFMMYQYLPSFLVKQFLFSRRNASLSATYYLGFQALGRIIGVFVIPYFSFSKVAFLHVLLAIFTHTLMVLCTRFELPTAVIFIVIAISGVSLSNLVPNIMSYIEVNHFQVTGKISTILTAIKRIADVIIGALLSVCMERYSPAAFAYIAVIYSIVIFISLIAIIFYTKYTLSKEVKPQADDADENSNLNVSGP